MEIKDVNNNLNQLLFKNTAVNSSTQALGAGFASLLGQTTMALDIVSGDKSVDVKADVSSDSVKKPNSKKTVADASKKTTKSDAAKDDKNSKNVAAKAADKKVADKPTTKKTKVADDSASVQMSVSQPEQQVMQESAPVADGNAAATVVDETAVADVAVEVVADVVVEADALPADVEMLPVANAEMLPETSLEQTNNSELQAFVATDQVQTIVADSNLVIKTADNQEMPLADFAAEPEKLQDLGEIKVVNPDTGAAVNVDGQELYVQLQAYVDAPAQAEKIAAVMPETVDKANAEAAENVAAPVVAEVADAPIENVSKDEKTTDTQVKNTKPQMAKVVSDAKAYTDDVLAVQAAQLDEVLPDDVKAKVAVDVKEEKIAYTASSSDLIKDKLTLEEALQAVADASQDVNQTTLSDTESQISSTNSQSNVNSEVKTTANAMPAAAQAVVAAVENTEAVTSSATISGVSEIGSASMTHTATAAAANSSEFVNQARAENAKTADTSFRDVLKGMEKEVVEQVKVNITKSAVKGVDKINIQLKPEDLGHIEVKMQISKDGKLQAHIIASRPETLEVLQKEIQNLERAFNEAGFQTDADSLSFSFQGGNQAGQESNSELRSFIGNIFEHEAQEEIAGNDNLQNWTPAQGLNIRV